MRVMVIGLRGIPDVQGGVETHAQQLYPRLARKGCQVELAVRTPFVPRDVHVFEQVRLLRVWSPRIAGIEALVHSVLCVLLAGLRRPDILHIHAIGPAITAPVARLLGLKVVVTHHGPDYERDKWRYAARMFLRLSEAVGMRCAHARIAISNVIQDLITTKYGLKSILIPNGVVIPELSTNSDHVRRFGLVPGKYFLQVGRLVPEKRQLDLIEAYRRICPCDWNLALVGAVGEDAYAQAVKASAHQAGVVMTGYLKGEELRQLYSHAGAFVLPSSHEGLPIAMLEALSFGLSVIASDIPANVEVGLDESCYFPVGDIRALANALRERIGTPRTSLEIINHRAFVACKYDWDQIAERTLAVYSEVAGRARDG